MPLQLGKDILSLAGVIDEADKCGAKLDICNILRNIAAHTAVLNNHAADIASCSDKFTHRIPFYVYEYRADYNNPHVVLLGNKMMTEYRHLRWEMKAIRSKSVHIYNSIAHVVSCAQMLFADVCCTSCCNTPSLCSSLGLELMLSQKKCRSLRCDIFLILIIR